MAVSPGTGNQRASYDSQSFALFNIAQQQVDAAFREQGFDDIFKMPDSMKDIDAPALFSSATVGPGDSVQTSPAQPVPPRPAPVTAAPTAVSGPARGGNAQQQYVAQQARSYAQPSSTRPPAQVSRPAPSSRASSINKADPTRTVDPSRKHWNWLLYAGIACTLLGMWLVGVPLLIAAVVRRALIERDEGEGVRSPFSSRGFDSQTGSGARFTMPDGAERAGRGSRTGRSSSAKAGSGAMTSQIVIAIVAIIISISLIIVGFVSLSVLMEARADSLQTASRTATVTLNRSQDSRETIGLFNGEYVLIEGTQATLVLS